MERNFVPLSVWTALTQMWNCVYANVMKDCSRRLIFDLCLIKKKTSVSSEIIDDG